MGNLIILKKLLNHAKSPNNKIWDIQNLMEWCEGKPLIWVIACKLHY